MIFLLAVVALALAIGYLAGGRLSGFDTLRLRAWWLAPLGLALQVQFPWLRHSGPNAGVPYLIASYGVLILFAGLNLRLAGFPLILAGLALNLLVVGVNDGMPVTRSALVTSGQEDVLKDLRSGGAKHHLSSGDDVLLPIADVIPIPPPIRQVVSVGDVLIYGGMVWLVVATMRGNPSVRRIRRRKPAVEP
jgi:Family of unknown function (DUF5317)